MRYTTTSRKSRIRVVHHEHEPWATECGRDTTDVAHEIASEALAAGIAAGTLRMCRSCERVHAARHTAKKTLRVSMRFDADDIARLKAKDHADRAAYRATMDARIAAHAARYGAAPAPAPTPVEGAVVTHTDESEGCLPDHATDPDVRAAIGVLELFGYVGATLRGDDPAKSHDANGFRVEPRGSGRLAIYHLVDGQRLTADRGPWAAELREYRDTFRHVGWTVESFSVTCLFVHRPEGDGRPGIEVGATVRTPHDRLGTITELCVVGGVARATVDGGLTWRADSLELFPAPALAGAVDDVARLKTAIAGAVASGNVAEVDALLAHLPAADPVRQEAHQIRAAVAARRQQISESGR